jgi:hypothetical protein
MVREATLRNMQMCSLLWGGIVLPTNSAGAQVFFDGEVRESDLGDIRTIPDATITVIIECRNLGDKSREICENFFYGEQSIIFVKWHIFLMIQDEDFRQFIQKEGSY